MSGVRPVRMARDSDVPDDYGGLRNWLLREVAIRPGRETEWLDLLAEVATDLGEEIEERR